MRGLRLLWVTPNLPLRGVAAARERWWNLLARLARRHEITLLAFVDPEDAGVEDGLPPGLTAVHRVSKQPWTVDDPLALLPRTVRGAFCHPGLTAAIAARLAAQPFDLVQYEYVEMANLVPPTSTPSILTVHQLGFAQEGPHWRVQGGGAFGAGALALFRHLRDLDWELAAVRRAHHVVTLSPEDASRLRRFVPGLRLSTNPMGVDTQHYRPDATPAAAPTDLLFVGHFGHPPNVDAVHSLVRDVLPRLERPVRLRIIGHAPPPEIIALGERGEVEVTGAVPDVRPHLAAARVVVAPVRFGTGMRGKVLEALAMGRPVVTTSLGAEGLGATTGEQLLIADDAAACARAIRRLLADPALATRVGTAARAFAVERFDWDAIATGHDEIYESVRRDPGPAPLAAVERAALVRRTVGRLGWAPAIAAGIALVMTRGLYHYVAAGRMRRPRPTGATTTAVHGRAVA
jgi:glycosyltransferase involved in cell wall biosynthesis